MLTITHVDGIALKEVCCFREYVNASGLYNDIPRNFWQFNTVRAHLAHDVDDLERMLEEDLERARGVCAARLVRLEAACAAHERNTHNFERMYFNGQQMVIGMQNSLDLLAQLWLENWQTK